MHRNQRSMRWYDRSIISGSSFDIRLAERHAATGRQAAAGGVLLT
jgi:hypothetical protein